MEPPRLLVVEDDSQLRELLVRGLREEGFTVVPAADGATAMRAAEREFEAAVLDIGLPDADGRDVCQALRARGFAAPVVFLTARDAMVDRLSGFSAGGDDYLSKPFHMDELVARLRALIRLAARPPAGEEGALRLDPRSHALHGPAGDRPLTPTEFRVLALLVARPGEAVRRRELVAAGWPAGARVQDNTLDQYLARVRRKLRECAPERQIVTVHGVGYRFE